MEEIVMAESGRELVEFVRKIHETSGKLLGQLERLEDPDEDLLAMFHNLEFCSR